MNANPEITPGRSFPGTLAVPGRTESNTFGRRLAVLFACLAGVMLHAGDAPELSLSLQGIANETVEQGEPLRVTVRIEAPDSSTAAWTLAPASGTWAEAVAVEILSENRDETVARGAVVGTPDQPHAVIDRDRVAGGLWRFGADAMQRLAPGSYRVRATLTVRNGTGWKGTAQSDALTLNVIAPSNAPERVGLKALALARDALLMGETEKAASLLDAELTRDPKQFRLLLLRAAVAERVGNHLAAELCLNVARVSAGPKPVGYPNVELAELSRRVADLRIRLNAGAPPVDPPAWSWPPDSVAGVRP